MSAPTQTGGGGGSAARDAAASAQQSGQQVVGSAADHAKDLGGSVTDKASEVVSEAGDKARDLVSQTRDQVGTEAENRRGQAVSTLRSLGDELDSMQSHEGESGWATELASRGSGYVRQTADWLDNRDPSQILDDVKGFARRRPGTFLVGALLAGVVAGRLTRAVKAGAPETAGTGTGRPLSGGGLHEAPGHAAAPGAISSSSPVHTAGVAYESAPEFPTHGDPFLGGGVTDDLTTPLPTRTDGTL